jgi:hypothetical protein
MPGALRSALSALACWGRARIRDGELRRAAAQGEPIQLLPVLRDPPVSQAKNTDAAKLEPLASGRYA